MSSIRTWLLAIISCGFLISLIGTLPLSNNVKKVMLLCGSCLMILTVVGPLGQVDPSDLPELLPELYPDRKAALEEAAEKNEALLRELILSQTLELLEKKTLEWGLSVRIQVELQKDPASGLYSPWSVRLEGDYSEEGKEKMAEYLEEEVNIPRERQTWIGP